MNAEFWQRWIEDHRAIYEYAVNRVMANGITRSNAEHIVADLVDKYGPGYVVEMWIDDHLAEYRDRLRNATRDLESRGHPEAKAQSLAETCLGTIILEQGYL